MGMYKVLKPFKMSVNGSTTIFEPGSIIPIELFSIASKGLSEGRITRDLQAAIPGKTSTTAAEVKKPYTEEQESAMAALSKPLGMTIDAIWIKVNAIIKKGSDFESAVYALRRQYGHLTDEELISDFAEEIEEPAEELQAEVYECAEAYSMNVGEAITWFRIARKYNVEPTTVFERMIELTSLGVNTPRQAQEQIEKDLEKAASEKADTEEVEQVEINGNTYIIGQTRVTVSERNEKWGGRTGTVVNVTDSGTFYVDIDDDEAEYRKIADDSDLTIIEDEEGDDASNGEE